MSYIQAHLRDRPHWVYRIFDEDDQLLYIGCTSKHPYDRIVMLRAENPKVAWSPIHHWTAEQFVDGATAEMEEGRLIDALHPPLNRHRSAVRRRRNRQAASPRPIHAESGAIPPRGRWRRERAS